MLRMPTIPPKALPSAFTPVSACLISALPAPAIRQLQSAFTASFMPSSACKGDIPGGQCAVSPACPPADRGRKTAAPPRSAGPARSRPACLQGIAPAMPAPSIAGLGRRDRRHHDFAPFLQCHRVQQHAHVIGLRSPMREAALEVALFLLCAMTPPSVQVSQSPTSSLPSAFSHSALSFCCAPFAG